MIVRSIRKFSHCLYKKWAKPERYASSIKYVGTLKNNGDSASREEFMIQPFTSHVMRALKTLILLFPCKLHSRSDEERVIGQKRKKNMV